MEQTGNEIRNGVRCLWREWRGMYSNVWEVIRCESPTCVLQKPCFSHTCIKLHHGEEWRWERLYAWVAGAGSTGFHNGIWNECCVIPIPSLLLYRSLWWVWIGWDITTTNKETKICEYPSQQSLLSIVLLSLEPPTQADIHQPLLLSCPYTTLQYLSFSSSSPPLLAVYPPIPENSEQYCLYALSPVLCQAQNLLEEHNLSDCMVCFQPSYISPGGQAVLANFVGCR